MSNNNMLLHVICISTCSETRTFDICCDSSFLTKEDAMLYCQYNNFWNEMSDGSNVREYYITNLKRDEIIDHDDAFYAKEYKETRKIMKAFYDTNVPFDQYKLTYTVDIVNKCFSDVVLLDTEQQKEFIETIQNENELYDIVSVENCIKYIQICNKDMNYDFYCTIVRRFYKYATIDALKLFHNKITDSCDCDGEILIGSLLGNISFVIPIYHLLEHKIMSIEDLMSRSGNNNQHMLANTSYEYELIVRYLSGECDKYGKKYSFDIACNKHHAIQTILNDTTDVKYEVDNYS